MQTAIDRILRRWGTLFILVVLLGTTAIPSWAQAPPSNKQPEPQQFPVMYEKNGARLIIYQPQLDDWRNFRELTADTAISVTPSGGKAVLGVVSWSATTLADTQTRIVLIKDFKILNVRFPSLEPVDAAAAEKTVRDTYTSTNMTVSLDRLLAGFHTAQTPAPTVTFSTDPPAILASTSPAILLFVDGKPVRVPIEGTKLEHVVNTTWDLFYDGSDYYLLDEKVWLKSKDLAGPWVITTKLPADMSKLPADESWNDVRATIPPATTIKSAPQVFFVDKPTELLLFKGNPKFTSIPGTVLRYATNTEDDVFLDTTDGRLYVLLSGRWFRAKSLQGPWTYASNDLPADFARIPAQHERAHVLASVPGTQAARDAVLLAQVPTTAVINRAEAEAAVKVSYAGDPQFKQIEGTSLSYAQNTQEKVIKVGDLYYLCFQGVWFVSTSPQGPWMTADSVPKAIYEIPATSPVYNITYVTVTNPTPTTVESSYTGGYMGMFVLGAAVGACIAYGTGYYYPPYYYWGPRPWPIYYPYPYSYGFRAVYNPYTGFYGIGGAVYGPYGAAGRAAWYNPSTGLYGRAATVQTAWGGRTVAGVYNPWTGNSAITHQGWNQYAQWGSTVINHGGDVDRVWHVATDNNVYAGKDGNVYRRDSNGSWSKYDDGNWVPVEKSTAQQRKTGGDAAGQRPGAGGEGVQKQPGTATNRPGTGGEGVQKQPGSTGQQRPGAGGEGVQKQPPERRQVTPAAERERPATPPESRPEPQRRATVPADTQRQLDREASARAQGAARERNFNRGAGGTGGMRRHR